MKVRAADLGRLAKDKVASCAAAMALTVLMARSRVRIWGSRDRASDLSGGKDKEAAARLLVVCAIGCLSKDGDTYHCTRRRWGHRETS